MAVDECFIDVENAIIDGYIGKRLWIICSNCLNCL